MAFWKEDKEVKSAVDRLNVLMEDEEKLIIAFTFATTQDLSAKIKVIIGTYIIDDDRRSWTNAG